MTMLNGSAYAHIIVSTLSVLVAIIVLAPPAASIARADVVVPSDRVVESIPVRKQPSGSAKEMPASRRANRPSCTKSPHRDSLRVSSRGAVVTSLAKCTNTRSEAAAWSNPRQTTTGGAF